MKYSIEFKSDALKFLSKQPKKQQIRLKQSIEKLPNGDIKKLISLKNNNLYRLRVRQFQSYFFY